MSAHFKWFRLDQNQSIPIHHPSNLVQSPSHFSLDPSMVERTLKKRKCMMKQKIRYVFLHDTGETEVVHGYIVKWDPEYTKTGVYKKVDYRGRPAPWQTRFSRQTIRIDLRPDLYGKMNRHDGWTFVNESAVVKKCKV